MVRSSAIQGGQGDAGGSAHGTGDNLQLVGREGTITGTEAARQLAMSQALASHHLRQLAKYGFIERATAGDDRVRSWRVTSTSMDTRSEHPEGRAATDLLQQQIVQQAVVQLQEWQERRDQYDARWARPTDLVNGLVYPAPPHRRPRHSARRRGPGHFTILATPVAATEHGG